MSSINPLRLRPVALPPFGQGSGPAPLRRRRMIVLSALVLCVAGAVALAVLGVHSPGAPRPATLILATHRSAAPALPAPTAVTPPAPVAAAAVGVDLPAAASLPRLNLYGTVARGDPTTGYALLGATQQTASLYGSGVEVAPGVFLQKIYTDRVVMQRNGVLLELRIASSAGASQGGFEATPGEDAPPPLANSADMLRTGASQGMPGIVVYPGRNRGAFAQLGLHPGDLVTAINGAPVTGPDAIDLQQMLKDLGHSTVTVFRAGRLQQLSVQHADSADAGNDDDTD